MATKTSRCFPTEIAKKLMSKPADFIKSNKWKIRNEITLLHEGTMDSLNSFKEVKICHVDRKCIKFEANNKKVPQITTGRPLGRQGMIEKLWLEFFSDPSQWSDNRSEKINPRYPDFKHKKTQESLWLDGNMNPPWVQAELAAMTPGILQVDLFTWNQRVARYAKAGQYEKTMELFQKMQREGMNPGKYTFIPVLNACSGLRALEEGKCIHTQIIKYGLEADVYVGNSLIDMYAKCGSIGDAYKVFNNMPTRTVVSWNALILGYVKCGEGQKAVDLFEQMQQDQVEPDPVTFVGVLNAYASVAMLEEGRRAHEEIIRRGYETDIFIACSLIDMYAKCECLDEARLVFENMPTRNVVAWSAMILGCVKCGEGQKAIKLFEQMCLEGVKPNLITFVGVLNACASVSALEVGRHVHEQIIESGCESDILVASSLVDMYSKCGSIVDAQRVFEKMPTCDMVTWTAMIRGYLKCGKGQKALELFHQMQHEGVDPDASTFVVVLNACASVAAVEEGRCVHKQVIQSGCEADVFVASSLIDMYAKCGSVEDAKRVFKNMPTHDVVSWTAMLGAYAMHGHSNEVLRHFERMCEEGVEIDVVTFVSLLSACSHGGLVDEGFFHFESMQAVYNIPLTVDHQVCIVDLLGRAGRLHEAQDLSKETSFELDVVWISLLSACRLHGNVGIGDSAAKQVVELDPGNATSYLLISNIHAASGELDSVAVHQERLERVAKKIHGI